MVDWECGGRDAGTLSRLLERVERWKPRLYCTDDWAAYAELIPQGRLFVGKEETHGIERDNSRQRHWLARFRRRSCVVSKVKRMVDASIALYVRFADDAGIGELLSMAKLLGGPVAKRKYRGGPLEARACNFQPV